MEEAGPGRAARCDSQSVDAFSDLGYCEWFFNVFHKPLLSQTIHVTDHCGPMLFSDHHMLATSNHQVDRFTSGLAR